MTVADSRGDVDDTCTTTVAGGYSLTCLGTGPYTLVASRSHYLPAALSLCLPGPGPHIHDVELSRPANSFAGFFSENGSRRS